MFLARSDYLQISSGYSSKLRVYCGQKTGQTVLLTGDNVMITFHTNSKKREKGFLLFFTAVPIGK